jgi:putative hydrolase of the HAD superfamily
LSTKPTAAVRVLALDVDGVVLGDGQRRPWDEHIVRDLGVSKPFPQEKLFAPHWYAAAIGMTSIRDGFKDVIEAEGLALDVDEVIRYWFKDDVRHVNTDVIHEALVWRQVFGGRLFLATNQEALRAAHIWDGVGLRAHFDGMLVSCELGAVKPSPEFFAAADESLGVDDPAEVFFIDDGAENVAAAQSHGWRATRAAGEEEVVAAIQALVAGSKS